MGQSEHTPSGAQEPATVRRPSLCVGNNRGFRLLIGGVGYRWMGDASFGLVASDALARQEWPPGIEIDDLGYGAIYVGQDLANATPAYDRLILIAGVERGREPGRLDIYRWTPRPIEPDDLQARIREAGAGVVDLDHLLIIASYFGGLPDYTEVVEFEPVDTTCGDRLSRLAASRLGDVIRRIRREALAVVYSLETEGDISQSGNRCAPPSEGTRP